MSAEHMAADSRHRFERIELVASPPFVPGRLSSSSRTLSTVRDELILAAACITPSSFNG